MAKIPSGIGVWWPGTAGSIPSGWTRNTDFDNRFPKGTASGTNPNTTGGSSTHTHTSSSHNHSLAAHSHTYTMPATPGAQMSSGGSVAQPYASDSHNHTGTSGNVSGGTSGSTAASWGTGSSDPAYYRMIYIQSDESEDGFPDGCVVLWNDGSAPSGWTQHAASVTKYIYGSSGGDGGGGTGGGSHTHTASSHTHSGDTSSHDHGTVDSGNNSSSIIPSSSGAYGVNVEPHQHPVDMAAGSNTSTPAASTSGATGSITSLPPYRILLGIENTANENHWLENAIAMWVGTLANIPDDWVLCDGGSGTPDMRDKYIKLASNGGGDVEGTGGYNGHQNSAPSAHSHSGSGSHTHTFTSSRSWPTSTTLNTHLTGLNSSDGTGAGHGHYGTTTSAATTPSYGSGSQGVDTNSDAQPSYRTVAYLQAPEEPASGNAMFFAANF